MNQTHILVVDDEPHIADSLADFLRHKAGYTVTTEVRFDSHPAEAIARYVQNHDINMIAMTTHGRTGLTRLVFGSVAQYLMTHLDVPIMIVRPNANFGEIEE